MTHHFPNESAEYRRARNALLVEEIELRRHIDYTRDYVSAEDADVPGYTLDPATTCGREYATMHGCEREGGAGREHG